MLLPYLNIWEWEWPCSEGDFLTERPQSVVPTYLQLPLRQWDAGNVYLLVLSKGKFSETIK